jgi:hypothetical protein
MKPGRIPQGASKHDDGPGAAVSIGLRNISQERSHAELGMIYFVIGLAVVVVVFVAVVLVQPPAFRITRSMAMAAPVQSVFEQVNDFHHWGAWSPWAKIDPDMKQTYDGSAAGAGAKYAWVGNKKVGEGRMTILESRPNELIQIKLEFLKPFKATNTAEFTFKPQGEQTQVVWTMFGDKNFMSKAFGLFVNMDQMIGKDFENGLMQMKAAVEK